MFLVACLCAHARLCIAMFFFSTQLYYPQYRLIGLCVNAPCVNCDNATYCPITREREIEREREGGRQTGQKQRQRQTDRQTDRDRE